MDGSCQVSGQIRVGIASPRRLPPHVPITCGAAIWAHPKNHIYGLQGPNYRIAISPPCGHVQPTWVASVETCAICSLHSFTRASTSTCRGGGNVGGL